ncbi:MAG: ABC transporter permease [Proteobacteria bacterium]|nr:ABC transporter permease [Desulfocapsa sp.]MBU3943331.1 ABC transporter permease [Pseudomonadota bacterium]MCG2744529.1 ABC transporter permease [Desulfobacteraceae bacterium]MBU3983569.1 ABC transporter permease [Pseudomonadota bacterium]MBU4028488.1 ABC transporter permease [Pseudomonadota bacterium]
MLKILQIALRNLLRYKRRTLLTASLITVGVVFVLLFMSVSGSFKNMMVGQITDSMLGHLQVHRKGYVASIDNLPLTLNMKAKAVHRLQEILDRQPEIEASSPRIKFGAMFSNYTETSNVRLNGVVPEKEFATVPLLSSRITEGRKTLKRGEILVPALLSKGMKVKVDDTVVIIATNKDGSVNGRQFVVAGILDGITGPGGRDGYLHFDDAVELLRMEEAEVSEIAIRLKNFDSLHSFSSRLEGIVAGEMNKENKPLFEIHTWEKLSPFFNISKMIDLMTLSIKLMLTMIVLISITNVMIMAVYERIREIGTIAAIGTLPGKILSMFVVEGFLLGVFGAIIGGLVAMALVKIVNIAHLTFDFGQQKDLLLVAQLHPKDLLFISITVIVVSVIASLYPAVKASRMDPIQALRHV